MPRPSLRPRLLPSLLLFLLLALALLLGASPALAQIAAAPAKPSSCTERCFTLDRLRITGRLGDGALRFELTGSVLADGAVAVPLFGPPAHVRLADTTEDGRAALVGFEGDHYYLYTASHRFVLKGALSLEGDLTLIVPGPLNTLETDIAAGTVLEGSRMSGLTAATVHFSASPEGGQAAHDATTHAGSQEAAPTVFQLSRAVRVGREIGFEYHLVLKSGTDLGVVRLPLAFGERVLDVTGVTSWRVEAGDLVLPTSGRSGAMTVTGTLASVVKFSPDARSAYEWWLIESDPEHRIKVESAARQVDVAQSPIHPALSNSRLYLVQKGQELEVGVTALSIVDVLGAVVRNHERTLVLTTRGDVVSDDTVTYENSGIDYLLYTPNGRPIYLAGDGQAERIMHEGQDSHDVLVPLRTGSHTVRVQAITDAALHPFAGRLPLPMPSYPLTASRVAVTVGVPPRVFPLALTGGDRWTFAYGSDDLAAILLGIVVGWFAVRIAPGTPRPRAGLLRLLAGLVLGGLWFVSTPLYVLATSVAILAGAAALVRRVPVARPLAVAFVIVLGCVVTAMLASLTRGGAGAPPAASAPNVENAQASRYMDAMPAGTSAAFANITNDNNFANPRNPLPGSLGGVVEGVTPVALTLPSSTLSLHATRELVTKDRPFKPVLVYLRAGAVTPLALLWLAGLVVVLRAQRAALLETYRRTRERLASAPAPALKKAKEEAAAPPEAEPRAPAKED